MVPQIIHAPDGTIELTFMIEENLRLKVNDVLFEGATRFSLWDLRHSVANQFSFWNWLPLINDYLHFGIFDRSEIELDKARLREK
jgi:outer membrane protein insertion porin family